MTAHRDTDRLVAVIDDLMRPQEDHRSYWSAIAAAQIRLGGLVVDAEDRDALRAVMSATARQPHREAWLTARGILRQRRTGSGERISRVTASLPTVALLVVQARDELARVVECTAPGALRLELERVLATLDEVRRTLYPEG